MSKLFHKIISAQKYSQGIMPEIGELIASISQDLLDGKRGIHPHAMKTLFAGAQVIGEPRSEFSNIFDDEFQQLSPNDQVSAIEFALSVIVDTVKAQQGLAINKLIQELNKNMVHKDATGVRKEVWQFLKALSSLSDSEILLALSKLPESYACSDGTRMRFQMILLTDTQGQFLDVCARMISECSWASLGESASQTIHFPSMFKLCVPGLIQDGLQDQYGFKYLRMLSPAQVNGLQEMLILRLSELIIEICLNPLRAFCTDPKLNDLTLFSREQTDLLFSTLVNDKPDYLATSLINMDESLEENRVCVDQGEIDALKQYLEATYPRSCVFQPIKKVVTQKKLDALCDRLLFPQDDEQCRQDLILLASFIPDDTHTFFKPLVHVLVRLQNEFIQRLANRVGCEAVGEEICNYLSKVKINRLRNILEDSQEFSPIEKLEIGLPWSEVCHEFDPNPDMEVFWPLLEGMDRVPYCDVALLRWVMHHQLEKGDLAGIFQEIIKLFIKKAIQIPGKMDEILAVATPFERLAIAGAFPTSGILLTGRELDVVFNKILGQNPSNDLKIKVINIIKAVTFNQPNMQMYFSNKDTQAMLMNTISLIDKSKLAMLIATLEQVTRNYVDPDVFNNQTLGKLLHIGQVLPPEARCKFMGLMRNIMNTNPMAQGIFSCQIEDILIEIGRDAVPDDYPMRMSRYDVSVIMDTLLTLIENNPTAQRQFNNVEVLRILFKIKSELKSREEKHMVQEVIDLIRSQPKLSISHS